MLLKRFKKFIEIIFAYFIAKKYILIDVRNKKKSSN